MSALSSRPLNYKNATPAEYAALNAHQNRLRMERLPDDPPTPLEETVKNLQSMPPFVDVRLWAIWTPDQGQISALANFTVWHTEDNQHMGQCDITVLPEYRRQGLARRLLEQVAAAAREEKRRLLLTNTTDRIPAGESFMLRLGGVRGLVGHTNQLNLDDLDHSLVADWLERGDRSRFELGFWDGDYPEEVLTEVAKLYELTNQQPFDDLDIEEMHMTPEELRQIEANHAARGNQRWTCYVRERQTGRFAGYTDTVWNSNRPRILLQDMTGVFPEFRNHGLGRWLKAAMLNKVLQERPQVKFVRTHNADSNAAMLKINNELGFKPYSADALWQVELEKVQQYLASRTQ